MRSKELTPLLTAREAAEFLNVSMFTLSKIEREGSLVPFRTPGGHRRYSLEMLREYLESTRDHPLNSRKKLLSFEEHRKRPWKSLPEVEREEVVE